MRRLVLVLFAFLLLVPVAAHAAKDEVSAEERYELGIKYMKRGYYTKALEAFNRVRNYHRDDPISVKAELAIADVYYKKGDFEQARLQYEDFIRLHPRNEDLDYAVWRDGECLYKRAPKIAGRDQTPTRQAVNVWTGFDTRFPASEHKDDVAELLQRGRNRLARKELAIAHFYQRRDAWLAVRRRAEGMVSRYPDSDLVPKGLALAGIAYHRWGMDADAQRQKERLAADFPDSRYLAKLERVLETPPGTPPVDDPFPRPYRLPAQTGGGGAGAGAPQQ
jgi:outer membrane protein assembly factor BamD